MSHVRTTSVFLSSRTDDSDLDACDYTIGWLSTTEEEFLAALSVIDESHASNTRFLQLNENRIFEYRLGRMGNHNVAISLPRIGLSNEPAAVVDDMQSTFPSLRFVVLAGTASGVPPLKYHGCIDEHAADVRLGDVIIGTSIVDPNSCDAVRAPENQLEWSPSRAISTGITEFKRRVSEGQSIELSLTSIVRQRGSVDNRFSRPNPYSDRLYRADYAHTPTSCECSALGGTSVSMTIPRTPRHHGRQLQVHYGPIRSVDKPIVDARLRDELAHENTVLCFLTGISDVATKIDCLPVCGVCDYADSHHYREWRGYAALSAAVCAKELLASMTGYMVLEMKIRARVDGIYRVIDNYVQDLGMAKGSLKSHQTILSKIEQRVDDLTRIVSGIENKHADTLYSANVDISSVKGLDEHLQGALKRLEGNIISQIKTADYVTRDQWIELQVKVQQNTARLDTLKVCMENLNNAIDLGEEVLRGLENETGNKTLGEISKYLSFSKPFRDKVTGWVPTWGSGKLGPFDQAPEETSTPDQPKATDKWRYNFPFVRTKKGATEKNPVVAPTEDLDMAGPSHNPGPSSNYPPHPFLNQNRDVATTNVEIDGPSRNPSFSFNRPAHPSLNHTRGATNEDLGRTGLSHSTGSSFNRSARTLFNRSGSSGQDFSVPGKVKLPYPSHPPPPPPRG